MNIIWAESLENTAFLEDWIDKPEFERIHNMINKSNKYSDFFNGEFLMGPNSIYLLDELLIKYPLDFNRRNTVLDLGCGKGLTSLFLANETGAKIYANDLWIDGEENRKRFEEWNIDNYVISSHEDATQLSFEKEKFDAIISIDAYHYFAGKEGFFNQKILPFVKPNGIVLIAIPGIKAEYEGQQDNLLGEWLGDEAHMLHSCNWWKNIIGESYDIESLKIWEMENFSLAWNSWLSVDNEFAVGDKSKFDSIISKYTCFVGIAVNKR